MLRKTWLVGSFLALVLGVSACGGSEQEAGDAPGEAASAKSPGEEAPSGAESDLSGVPEVVALVNGEEIPREDFAVAYEGQLQQAQGQKVAPDQLKQQVVESLVSTELLVQEAENRDITVTDRNVERTLEDLAAQNGLQSANEFVAALEQQGMDRAEVHSQVRTQVLIERLVADESGGIEASAKEVRALYDQLVAQQGQAGQQGAQTQELPPLAQVRPQLEEQVTSQKEAQVAQRLVGSLRERGDVVINL